MGLLSSFSPPTPSSCAAAVLSPSLTKAMWAAGPPLLRSEGESEPDNDLGDNNRAEETKERWGEDGRRMTEKWWVVREVFFHSVSFAPQ